MQNHSELLISVVKAGLSNSKLAIVYRNCTQKTNTITYTVTHSD